MLIQNGASLKAMPNETGAPLFGAIVDGSATKDVESTLSMLLEAKADLREAKLLLKAVDKRNFKVVPTLLALKANPQDCDNYGFSALHTAVMRASGRDEKCASDALQTVQILIDARASPNTLAQPEGVRPQMSPLSTACRGNQLLIAQSLISGRANIDASTALYCITSNDCGGLMPADLDLLKLRNIDGAGVMHAAAASGALVQKLLDAVGNEVATACAAIQDKNGVAPLMVAASTATCGSKSMEAVRLLMPLSGEHGGTHVRDSKGNIALHYTEDLSECEEVVRALVGAGGPDTMKFTNDAGFKPNLGMKKSKDCPVQ